MGNCTGKSDKVKKEYLRKKSKPGTDVSGHAELNDFDQAPQRNKEVYGAVGDDLVSQHLEFTLSNQDFINFISPFEDSSKFMLAVNKDINIIEVEKGSAVETFTHPKQVTQCFSFNDDNNIVSLWRDTIVRIFDINKEYSRIDTIELKGHSLSVTTGCVSLGETILATGGRDYTTILWDIEYQKETHKNRIDRNMVTDMKWMPTDNNTFVQCSEDLRMRFFDIREGLEIGKEISIGSNFATTFDIDDTGNYITTGHRGFNNSGWWVKLHVCIS